MTKLNYVNRKKLVEEATRNGTAMVSVYDISAVVTKLLEKGVDFKVDTLNNQIYMVTVTRMASYWNKTA